MIGTNSIVSLSMFKNIERVTEIKAKSNQDEAAKSSGGVCYQRCNLTPTYNEMDKCIKARVINTFTSLSENKRD